MNTPDNIILVGFMGTGKTTIGKLVAARLGWRFADTDQVIERRAGNTVRDIFATQGEPAFRQMESELCAEIGTWRRSVVATGGGILLNPTNYERLSAAGLVICLAASVEQIAARLEYDANRPLLHGPDRVQRLSELLSARAALYARVPHQVETSGLAPYTVSEKVMQLWQR